MAPASSARAAADYRADPAGLPARAGTAGLVILRRVIVPPTPITSLFPVPSTINDWSLARALTQRPGMLPDPTQPGMKPVRMR